MIRREPRRRFAGAKPRLLKGPISAPEVGEEFPDIHVPGRFRVTPVSRSARAFDPRYRLATMRNGMIGWALFNAYFALLLTHLSAQQLSGVGFLSDFILLLSCLGQLTVGSLVLRLPIRLPVAGTLFAIFMTWGTATTMLANGEIGRSFYAAISYYILWGFFGIFIYAAVEMGVNLSPQIRKLIVAPWLISLAFSGLVAVGQVAGLGFAKALSPTGAFGEVFRPTGLADYTFMLGLQGVLGMAIVGARLRERDLKWTEWIAVGFFMLVILIAQYRSLYYTGIALTGVLLLVLQFKRNRLKALAMGGLGVAAIIVPLVLFPNKFIYGMRGAENDPALMVRYAAWDQVRPVLAERPLTGIGADQNLMITTGVASIDKYAGLTMDNFYRMVLICYGYTGGLFMILTMVALGIGLFMRYDGSRAAGVKTYTIAALIVYAALLGVSTTGNSFVYRQVGYSFAVLLALGTPSWAERRLVDPVSPLLAFARTLARTPLRTLFPNLGRVR